MSTENILAIPSNDRLKDVTFRFLADSGITNGIQYRLSGRQLAAPESWFPVGPKGNDSISFTLALMKSKDIVKFVQMGDVAVGIVGLDTLAEYSSPDVRKPAKVLLELGIGRCRLSLAAPIERGFLSEEEFDPPSRRRALGQFSGLTIATEYPKLTGSCFYDIEASAGSYDCLEYTLNTDFTGSVEVAPSIGKADAVTCIIETGDTLKYNNLKELVSLFDSQAVLITRSGNLKGDSPFVDAVWVRFFESLLMAKNPDALKRKARIEAVIASLR